jgi:hypothetical protein
MKSKFILFAFISIFAFACKKDKTAPTLSISSPSDGAQATGVVVISGTVADEHLHTVTLTVTKDGTGVVLYNKTLTIDGKTTYGFSEQYDPGIVITSSNVTLTVEVSDVNSNKTSKLVKFTLVP